MPCIWNDWLPHDLAEEIKYEEPKRFRRIIDRVCDSWHSMSDACGTDDERVQSSLAYVPLVKGMLDAKVEPGIQHMQRLAETLYDIVLHTEADLTAQARWSAVLHRILRTHGKKMDITIEWKPLYSMLRRHHLVMSSNYEGAGVMEARRQALVHLLHQSRRFFPPNTAQEIWDYFKPAFKDPHSTEAFESIGWVCMMLPTQEALKGQGLWSEWMKEWMQIWGQRVHNQTWQSLWFSLMARLAKHDVHGVIDWHGIIRLMVNRFLWAFHVPLGSASASPPFNAGAPATIEALFANDMQSRSASTAKALIYSIGRENISPGAQNSNDEDPGLSCLETIVAIFEQYYHPSNGGKWSSGLAMFLRELAIHLCSRLVAEHSYIVSPNHDGMISGGESEEEPSDDDDDDDESIGTADVGVDSSVTDEDIATGGMKGGDEAESTPDNAFFPRRHLTVETRKKIVRLLMRLALKGQSGKDSSMRRNSSQVLSMLANIEPHVVLPEVQRHFFTALETITAARQYGNAIQTLSLCIRPMLIAGTKCDIEKDPERAPVELNSIQCIQDAMNATLPGIDANDPPKSLAVFRLYCCVLSCVGPLREDGIGLYSEEWANDLLARTFAVISNVDSPESGGEHMSHAGNKYEEGSSFLLDGNSMFRPLMELLFARLPEELRARAIKQTSKFLLGNTFLSVVPEAAILCNAMSWADPDLTEKYMLAPLVSMLTEECNAIKEIINQSDMSTSSELSKVQETTLSWRIGLLTSLVYHMGLQASNHADGIKEILTALLRCPSSTVQNAASRCLSSLLVGLSSYYPLKQYDSSSIQMDNVDDQTLKLERFVDKFGEWDLIEAITTTKNGQKPSPPTWHVPCDNEITLANCLLQMFLDHPSNVLLAAAAGEKSISKQEMRSLLLSMEGAVEGARSCLPDFEEQFMPAKEDAVSVIGKLGTTIGSGELRSKSGNALIKASKLIQLNDIETLTVYLRLVDSILAVGSAEYHSSDSSASAWVSDDKWLQQPAVSGFLQENGCTWRRRRPRWVAIEKVFMNLEWRASQASYRGFASLEEPWLPVEKIPKVYLDALSLCIYYMLKGGSSLRDLASSTVERCAKRYPTLSKHISAPLCAGISKIADKTDFDISISCVDMIPLLLDAAQCSAQKAAELAASGVLESEEEQSVGAGAASLLRWISSWRYFTRDYEGLRALILSLIASFTYQGPEAQISMTMAQLMLSLRSMRPRGKNAHVIADQICLDCIGIVNNAKNGNSPALSGRHETITIMFPLFILPDISANVSSKLIAMYASELVSDAPLVRKVAMIAIEMILLPIWRPFYGSMYSPSTPQMSQESILEAQKSLSSVLESEGSTLLPKIVQMFAMSHHSMASGADDGQSRRLRGVGGNKEETVVAAALSTLLKGLEWPVSTAGFQAINQGNFTVRHARVMQVLAQVNPSSVFSHLRKPIQEILAKPQDADKPSVAATAEILSGLLASGKALQDMNSDWDSWLSKTLEQALENSPLDFLNIWGDCVLRFAVNGLKEQDLHEPIGKILSVALSNKSLMDITRLPSSDMYKKVMYITEILQEMLGDATGRFPVAPTFSNNNRKMLLECIDAIPVLIEVACDTDMSRQAIAGLTADVCMIVLTMSFEDNETITMELLESKVNNMLDSIFARFDEATQYLFANNKDKVNDSSTSEMELDSGQQNGKKEGNADEDKALAFVAFVCELTYQFLAGASAHAAPLVMRPLKNIMRVLELIPSEAQFVGSTVRLALRSSKYQPLEPEYLDSLFSSLVESTHGELWTERAAALQFIQYFWFRNAINLGESGSENVLNEAMRLLEDPKLEVREMACATVSGVIRALSPERQEELRSSIIVKARQIFPDRKRRRVVGNGKSVDDIPTPLPVRHGAVLALRALVMSSPYDVPSWLPEILMALVRLASEPAPVKNTVSEALADFRRTHEEGGLLEVKDAMTSDQWEAIRDVAVGAASYFV